MPDTSPSSSALKKLGFKMPSAPPIDDKTQNKIARESQANDPLWKQYARQGVDALANIPKGLLGIDPAQDESSGGYLANVMSQLGGAAEPLVKAGLPFLAMTGGQPVFHGTGEAFEKFNPKLYDKSDTLGYMTHFAEEPGYAAQYADSSVKSHRGNRPQIIPAHIDAKNVLDLHNPNPDDLSQAIASLPSNERSQLVDYYRSMSRDPNIFFEDVTQPENKLKNLGRRLTETLNYPGSLEKTPFDAVRYNDAGNPSYAVPSSTPIKTPWGTSLNEPPKSLNVIRSDKGGDSTLKLMPDRWKNTPLDLPERPLKEQYKTPFTELTGDKKKYTQDEIHDMYFNNVISAAEKQHLMKNNLKK